MTTETVEEPVCGAPVDAMVRLVTAETADVCDVNDEAVTLPTFAETETEESPDTSCPFCAGTSFSATPDTVEDALRTPEPLLVRSAVLTTRLDCASSEPFAVGKRLHHY